MIKPILLIPERHWDALAKEALLEALPMLHRYGYDTYGIEMPSDYTPEDMIASVGTTIEVTEGWLCEIKPYLDKIPVTIEKVLELSCNQRAELFYNYVSSTKYNDYAVLFKELPAHRITKKIFDKVLRLKGTLRGFDLPRERHATLFNVETALDLHSKCLNVNASESERIASFVKHSLATQNEGKGLIFVVGQSHYEQYLAAFKKEECLNEVIVIHPHSYRTLYDNIEDRILTIKSSDLARQVTCLDRRLFTSEQFPAFFEELEQFLKPKLAKFYTAVSDHSATKKIENSIGVKLVARQRPSFFVDCMHMIEEGEDESMLVSKLATWGIFSTVALVDQQRQLLIPRVNAPEVSGKISQLK